MDIQLSNLSKYRSELMGIATICILICHCPSNNVLMPSVIKNIMFQGQLGNALFLMLSGFGLYYSLNAHYLRGESILRWYKKRYIRILVPYLIITLIPGFFIALLSPATDWSHYFLQISLISYWKYHDCAWFLSLLIPLYALSPLIYKSLFHRKNVIRTLLLYAIPLLLLPMIKVENDICSSIIHHCPNMLVFVIGIALGYYAQQQKKVNIFVFFAIGMFFLLMFFVQHRNFSTWYIGINFFAFPILLLLFEKLPIGRSSLAWFAAISLESYLTNTTLPSYVRLINWDDFPCNINYGNYLGYSLVIFVGLIWAYLVNKISKIIITKI